MAGSSISSPGVELKLNSSLVVSKRGEAERLTEPSVCFLKTSLCALPLWIFRTFAVLNLESHCSQGNASRWFWLVSKPVTTVDFLARKSSLRLAFLFRVDVLFFFLILYNVEHHKVEILA